MTTAAFTVITKSELAQARVLMDSVARVHPDWARHVLLIDEIEDCFDPHAESFSLLEIRYLPLADKQATLFVYDADELRGAVKPHFFAWLFETLGFDDVVYLDPTVWVRSPLTHVEQALQQRAPLVLTPHLLGDCDDLDHPAEADVLSWGALDGTLVGMSRHGAATSELLLWWLRRNLRDFFLEPTAPSRDQRWFDVAVARWPATIIRDPAYNVAHFNVTGRELKEANSEYSIRGKPLRFFQFAGLDLLHEGQLPAGKGRANGAPKGAERQLLAEYRNALSAADFEQIRKWPYHFDRFANGAPIHPLCRVVYRSEPQVRQDCGDDPFRAGPVPFNQPRAGSEFVTHLMAEIWRRRPDLQRTFPDLHSSRDARRLAEWFVATAKSEYEIGPEHVDAVRRLLKRAPVQGNGHALAARLAGGMRPERIWQAVNLALKAPAKIAEHAARFRRAQNGESLKAVEANGGLLSWQTRGALTGKTASARGINIVGYVTADLGLGQSARSAVAAAEAVGLDVCAIDFAMGTRSPKTDRTLARRITARNRHPVNLVHLNAEQIPLFRKAMGERFFEGKYTIGYWHWELPELPEEYVSGFAGLNEVWVPTQFVLSAISKRATVPVVLIPHSISFRVGNLGRSRFRLPDRKFLFLMMYDLFSFQERKNPSATLEAFKRAFGNRDDVGLVIKVINGDRCRDDLEQLTASLKELPGAILITETLSRQDVYELEAACDAFVSLHRSEGFGLGLAESMYLGKPVLGTNWSGNVDFMNHKNSCPVNYELVTLDRDYGPYKKGQYWAEADLDHAAWYMKKLVDDRPFARQIGERAKAYVTETFSPRTIGLQYLDRLRLLGLAG